MQCSAAIIWSAQPNDRLIFIGGVRNLLGEHDTSDCEGDVESPDDLRRKRECAGVSFVPLTQPLQPESGPALAHSTHVSGDNYGGLFYTRRCEGIENNVREEKIDFEALITDMHCIIDSNILILLRASQRFRSFVKNFRLRRTSF